MKNKNLKKLIQTIDSLSQADLEVFLEGILTPKELEEIPVRLEIVQLLFQKVPQREIAQRLGVGIATVTRGSREVQMGKFDMIKSPK